MSQGKEEIMSFTDLAGGDQLKQVPASESCREDGLLTTLDTELEDEQQRYGYSSPPERSRGQWLCCHSVVASLLFLTNSASWRSTLFFVHDGSGWFIFMYLIQIIVYAAPIYFLESVTAQYRKTSLINLFSDKPLFKGLAYCTLMSTCGYLIMNNSLLSWTMIYMYSSYMKPMRWSECDKPWNDFRCNLQETDCIQQNLTQVEKGVCVSSTLYGPVVAGVWNYTAAANAGISSESSVQQFFVYEVVQAKSAEGTTTWHLNTCLLIVTLLAMLGDILGIRSISKITFPCFLLSMLFLLVMFVHSVSQGKASEGLAAVLSSDYHHLLSLKSWMLAGLEALYSLGVGTGVNQLISSHEGVKVQPIKRTVLVLVPVIAINIIAGLTTAAWSGAISSTDIPGATSELEMYTGVLIPFISVPSWLIQLPSSKAMANIYYLQILLSGLCAQMLLLETLVMSLADEFEWIRQRKIATRVFISASLYSISLAANSGISGLSALVVLDYFSSGYLLLVILLIEVLVFCIYQNGAEKLSEDLYKLSYTNISYNKIVCWASLSILYLLMMFIYFGFETYPGIQTEPSAMFVTFLPLSALSCIPLYMLYTYYYKASELDEYNQIKSESELHDNQKENLEYHSQEGMKGGNKEEI